MIFAGILVGEESFKQEAKDDFRGVLRTDFG